MMCIKMQCIPRSEPPYVWVFKNKADFGWFQTVKTRLVPCVTNELCTNEDAAHEASWACRLESVLNLLLRVRLDLASFFFGSR